MWSHPFPAAVLRLSPLRAEPSPSWVDHCQLLWSHVLSFSLQHQPRTLSGPGSTSLPTSGPFHRALSLGGGSLLPTTPASLLLSRVYSSKCFFSSWFFSSAPRLLQVVGRTMASPLIYILIPESCEYVTGQKRSWDAIKLRILICEDYPGLSHWSQRNHKGRDPGKVEGRGVREGDVTAKVVVGVM